MATLRMVQEFVRRGQAAQRAVDQVLARTKTHQEAPQPEDLEDHQVLGRWIHLGCGGELVRLQGIAHPVCTTCAREVW